MVLKNGDNVEWTWGTGTAEGTVEQTFTRRVTRKIADGGRVLKLASELRKA